MGETISIKTIAPKSTLPSKNLWLDPRLVEEWKGAWAPWTCAKDGCFPTMQDFIPDYPCAKIPRRQHCGVHQLAIPAALWFRNMDWVHFFDQWKMFPGVTTTKFDPALSNLIRSGCPGKGSFGRWTPPLLGGWFFGAASLLDWHAKGFSITSHCIWQQPLA